VTWSGRSTSSRTCRVYQAIDSLWLYNTNRNILGGGRSVLTGPAFIDKSNLDKVAEHAEKGTR
jgi:simple sugar transport system substrate-binding protein